MLPHPHLQNNARSLRTNQTEAEKFVWSRLRRKRLGHKFIRQHILLNKYIVDFICLEKRLIIEIDGGQHCESTSDQKRDNLLTANGYKILRFWNNEIFENWTGCEQVIISELEK